MLTIASFSHQSVCKQVCSHFGQLNVFMKILYAEVYVLLFITSILFNIIWIKLARNENSRKQLNVVNTYSKSLAINYCKPNKFVFLKTHKSGSTTLKKLLQNFASKNDLSMSLPLVGPHLGGYPNSFDSTLYKTRGHYKLTDVIYDHLRWNWSQINNVLSHPKNHKRIAIIREPRSHFKSSFNYFYKKWNKKTLKNWRIVKNRWTPDNCFGEPYRRTVFSSAFIR